MPGVSVMTPGRAPLVSPGRPPHLSPGRAPLVSPGRKYHQSTVPLPLRMGSESIYPGFRGSWPLISWTLFRVRGTHQKPMAHQNDQGYSASGNKGFQFPSQVVCSFRKHLCVIKDVCRSNCFCESGRADCLAEWQQHFDSESILIITFPVGLGRPGKKDASWTPRAWAFLKGGSVSQAGTRKKRGGTFLPHAQLQHGGGDPAPAVE